MTSPAWNLDLDSLLAHQHWLRKLVVDLVGEADADDVLQQTWLAAWRSWPAPANPRRWLATVARNFALRWRGADRSRKSRELRSDSIEPLPSAEQIVASLQLQRRVAAAVAGLDEPYRSAVLWRYYEGLSVDEIAARAKVTPSAIRSRISRGLDQLRARLGAPDELRPLALLPLVAAPRPEIGATKLGLGVLFMSSITKTIVVAAAAGAIALALHLSLSEPDAPPATGVSGAGEPPPILTAPAPHDAAATAPARESIPTAADAEHRPADTTLLGAAVDDRGRPVPELAVEVANADDSGRLATTTDSAGRFALDVPPGEWRLEPGRTHVTLRRTPLHHDLDREALLVVAPAIDWRGRVVDEYGNGLGDVRLEVDSIRLPAFPYPLEHTEPFENPAVTTESDGHFRLASLPGSDQVRVWFRKHGYETRSVPCSPHMDPNAIVTLSKAASGRLSVVVVDGSGAPIPGATVRFGSASTPTDEHGLCSLEWTDRPRRVVVAAANFQPWRRDGWNRAAWEQAGSPSPWRIVLDDDVRALAGRIVDSDDRPLGGWAVTLLDSTPLGDMATAESVAAGGDAVPEDMIFARTGDDGTFRIDGLAARRYRLRAWHPETLVSTMTEPIDAGRDDVVIRIPANAIRERLDGTVIDRTGVPVPDVRLVCHIVTGVIGPTAGLAGDQVAVTDADGDFSMRSVPRHAGYLFASGPRIAPCRIDLADYADDELPRIVVATKRHVKLLACPNPPNGADAVAFVDEAGERVRMILETETNMSMQKVWPLADGASPILSVADTAVELVYLENGERVDSKPVDLAAGRVTEIQP